MRPAHRPEPGPGGPVARPRRVPAQRPPVGDASKPVYLIQTQVGVGALAWNEINATLRKANLLANRHVPQKDDVLLLQTASEVGEFFNLRTIEDVFIVAVRAFNIAATPNGIKQIHATVKNSPVVASALQTYTASGKRLPKNPRYRVITRATGRQEFTRRELGIAVTDAIADGWPGRWKVVEEEDDAEIEVWATLFGSELVVALRLSDASMRHRGPEGGRVVNRPAALRPVIAAAMVQLTQPQADDVFLDPMAGTGTLVAERGAAGPFDRLIAGDKNREAVKALTKNLQAVGGDLAIRRLDATDLPFADGEIGKIASNLPFGKQVSHPDELNLLYTEIFHEWVRVVRPGGLIVVLASEIDRVRTVLSRIPELRVRAHFNIVVLGQPATILQLERKK
ncbi:MAG TPA: methyltransferase domain-containing protein [Herpetosiphonaceae bacterium]|nr:methyltransferase domain-containing protein [Herpetosiphonaceae bacterium]